MELSTTYSPSDVEDKWYKKWEEGNYFAPKKGKKGEAFTVLIPPPNVTGRLHAGHALDVTTQDALIRFKRMKGYETLWIPGMDHAGIATQSVVERQIFETEKKTRHDFTREEFVKLIWKWKEEYGGIILDQQKNMGVSCDWNYSVFTMDKSLNKAVRKVFVDLYKEGLIYQSDYIINWDPVLQSAISDAEVEHKEVQGAFYHLLYEVKGTDEKLEIATTRPETLLGDTAVAVNPNDARFKHLIGKMAIIPIVNREVPIIGDEYVDMELGTGALKVTPGHDFNDFEIGVRHKLEVINILNKDGTLNEVAGEYAGLTCKKARTKIVSYLENQGILIKQEKHIHQVGHGDRSKAIIEPMVSKQWFMNVQEMAAQAVKAVEEDRTRFYHKSWENTFFSWLREPKNWCISRQLWWGHQIPVYYCQNKKCETTWASEEDPTNCPKCGENKFFQDPDVLDTWFSSGLWPMSTLGWPDEDLMKQKRFSTFFPTSTLVTGFDIIFFWVARMMMLTLKFTGEVPFKHVYIHAIVRDKLGRKMSKSLGNGIDPLEMCRQYGADSFRFTLAAGSGYNRGLNLDPERIGGYRNFINKIWNAFRFISPTLGNADHVLPDISKLSVHEKWILHELNETTKVMNESMEEYRYDDSCSAIYKFVYDKFCSSFIELSKPILNGTDIAAIRQRSTVLKHVFRKIVALLHPFSPFITEELWSHLKNEVEDLLIVQEYPEYNNSLFFSKEAELTHVFLENVTNIRNLRAAVNIKPKEQIKVEIHCENEEYKSFFMDSIDGFSSLAKVEELLIKNKNSTRPSKSIVFANTHSEIFVKLDGVIDLQEQINRLTKDLEKNKKEFEKINKKLQNENFMKNAPEEVVTEVKSKASEFQELISSIEKNIESFK